MFPFLRNRISLLIISKLNLIRAFRYATRPFSQDSKGGCQMSTTRENLRRNINAFNAMETELREKYLGQYALLYDEKLIGVFYDKEAARIEAARRFPEGEFAISPAIGAPPENLGSLGLLVVPAEV